jgi:hypothetical protein
LNRESIKSPKNQDLIEELSEEDNLTDHNKSTDQFSDLDKVKIQDLFKENKHILNKIPEEENLTP